MVLAEARERVVITGTGAITPLGDDVETTWQAILAGQVGIRVIPPPYPGSRVRYTAEPAGLHTDFSDKYNLNWLKKRDEEYLEARGFNFKIARRRDLTAGLGVLAARQAIAQAQFEPADSNDLDLRLRRAVSVGSGVSGALHAIKTHNDLRDTGDIYDLTATVIQPEQAATTISQDLGFMGSSEVHSTACESGLTGLVNGMRMLRTGESDVVLVGAVDALTRYPESYTIYEKARALAKVLSGEEPDAFHASNPFDLLRGGFVLSSGVAAVLLETLSHVKARGAEDRILAEVFGYGVTNDAFHDTQPLVAGQKAAMDLAVKDAGLKNRDITQINTHGTGTPWGDESELISIMLHREQNLDDLVLAATKSMTAHGIAYTGLLEIICLQLALRDQVVPPVPNLREMLEISDKFKTKYGIDVDPGEYALLSTQVRPWYGKYAMSNSFGFGGNNGSVIIGAYRGS